MVMQSKDFTLRSQPFCLLRDNSKHTAFDLIDETFENLNSISNIF